MLKDFQFWDTFDRSYRDRDLFSPKHISDLQQAKSKKANTDQSYTEAQDQFDSSDEVFEDDTLALAAKRHISTYGKTNASSSGTKRKASEESPTLSSVPSKRKPQGKKITVVVQLQEQIKDADDRVLQFLVESQEKDQEISGKLIQFTEQADKRNADIMLKLMEALGSAFQRTLIDFLLVYVFSNLFSKQDL